MLECKFLHVVELLCESKNGEDSLAGTRLIFETCVPVWITRYELSSSPFFVRFCCSFVLFVFVVRFCRCVVLSGLMTC